MTEIIKGRFKNIIYHTDSYMVARFLSDDDLITVTGAYFDIDYQLKYQLEGEYVDHPKYGFQFSCIAIKHCLPDHEEEIINFLSSPVFNGIGHKTALKIYEVLGDNTVDALVENADIIDEVNISSKQKESIKKGINAYRENNQEGILILLGFGFNGREARFLYERYHDDAVLILQENPFIFYHENTFISFDRIVECAKNIEFENKLQKYQVALLINLFKNYCFKMGDIYIDYQNLLEIYNQRYTNFDDILNECLEKEYVVFRNDHYYLKQDYEDEQWIADRLLSFSEGLCPGEDEISLAIKNNELTDHITYDDCQIEALFKFYRQNVSLILGGPGTGKTTMIRAIISTFKEIYPFHNIIVCAPTGRAAKRINELCDVESKTIHSLLRWNLEDNSFGFNEDNPIVYDAIIIDEFSMVDTNLFAALLKAASYCKKLLILGDYNQLPSIRPGNLIRDLIKSDIFDITYLDVNHRQNKGSHIIDLSQYIISNTDSDFDFNDDVIFYDINDLGRNDLISFISKDLSEGYELDDIEVLSPMYRGEFGIDNLNASLQNAFNPPAKNKNEKRSGTTIFREGDKVIQLKNRPNDDVYNGDVGMLMEIDFHEEYFMVDFSGTLVFYKFDEISDLSLAYCLSVHKAQGSEYRKVYFIVSNAHKIMLNQRLVYTAVSRARQELVILGDVRVFNQAINTVPRDRLTSIRDYLLEKKLILSEFEGDL